MTATAPIASMETARTRPILIASMAALMPKSSLNLLRPRTNRPAYSLRLTARISRPPNRKSGRSAGSPKRRESRGARSRAATAVGSVKRSLSEVLSLTRRGILHGADTWYSDARRDAAPSTPNFATMRKTVATACVRLTSPTTPGPIHLAMIREARNAPTSGSEVAPRLQR